MIEEHKSSGILLHVSSLPSSFGIGDFGPKAYRFVELIAKFGQSWWSILPLTPTSLETGNSPYKSHSAFAGNTLLISPELLVSDGFLPKDGLSFSKSSSPERVNYEEARVLKSAMLSEAYSNFKASGCQIKSGEFDFDTFCSQEANWLNNYALFIALKESSGEPWFKWPISLRTRENLALKRKEVILKDAIQKEKFDQFVFFSQWHALRKCCEKNGVKILGDLSFYIDHDSADVWANPELFKLDKHKKPEFVGGVPPDFFSKTGQLWGTPVYQWRQHRKTGFEWWLNRLNHNLKMCDAVRLDHFRGFISYWQIPAHNKTAKAGKWIRAPSKTFFKTISNSFPKMPFIAEDLGVITQPVRKTINELGIPGMRVLLFAFDGSKDNLHLPKNYTENSVVYTGTHDTNTILGWFKEEASSEQKERLSEFVGCKVSEGEVNLEFIKTALASEASLSIVPMQDVLGLGSESRMNHPARQMGNWEWRVTPEQLRSSRLNSLREFVVAFHRELCRKGSGLLPN